MSENKLENTCASETFNALFKAHSKSLRNYFFYKFGNLQAAEDIVQEAFVKLWKNCSKVPVEKAKSFLYTVGNNLSLNEKAHEKVVLRYRQLNKNNFTNESPEFILREKEFLITLEEEISKLPEKQRVAFLLHRIDKKTYKEISEVLNISVKAVEKRMHKALLQLRKKIEYL